MRSIEWQYEQGVFGVTLEFLDEFAMLQQQLKDDASRNVADADLDRFRERSVQEGKLTEV